VETIHTREAPTAPGAGVASGLAGRISGDRGDEGPKKEERPHSLRCHGRPSVNRLKSGLAPPFFSPPPPSADGLAGGRNEASVLIPRPDRHPTWFIHASAASRIGSRTDPSHCAPRRHIGAGGTRDWLHRSGPCDHQDQRYSGRASAPNISPDISPGLSPPSRTPVRSPTEATHC